MWVKRISLHLLISDNNEAFPVIFLTSAFILFSMQEIHKGLWQHHISKASVFLLSVELASHDFCLEFAVEAMEFFTSQIFKWFKMQLFPNVLKAGVKIVESAPVNPYYLNWANFLISLQQSPSLDLYDLYNWIQLLHIILSLCIKFLMYYFLSQCSMYVSCWF